MLLRALAAAAVGITACCLVHNAAAQHAINGRVPGMINSGTPQGVPASYDCSVREHAWEFGKATLPSRGDFKSLFDALQLQHCKNVSAPHPTAMDAWQPPSYPTPTASALLYVAPDAAAGGDGTKAKPFATLAQAVAAAAGKPKATILLRAGVHHSGQLVITAAHAGITFQNYQGEHAVVSGGVPIQATKADWKPFNVLAPHQAAAQQLGGEASNISANIWELDLSQLSASAAALSIDSIRGLRLDGNRAVRAKYPNGNPELSGPNAVEVQTYQAGWIDGKTDWIVPEDKWKETEDVVSNAADWPVSCFALELYRRNVPWLQFRLSQS
jgi:hypothetical protein